MIEAWREATTIDASIDLELHARESSNFRKHTSANPLQRTLIDRFHRTIVDRVAAMGPERVLDAGCGEGFVARLLLDRIGGLRLTGCELSDSALQLARTTNPEATFARGNITALPFADDAFDVVCCSRCSSICRATARRLRWPNSRGSPAAAWCWCAA